MQLGSWTSYYAQGKEKVMYYFSQLNVLCIGIALLYLHCACNHALCPDPADVKCHLEGSLRTLEPCLQGLDTHRPTFMCGAAGPLAIAASVYHKLSMSFSLSLSK